jgi:hypothetical protein
MLLAVGAGTECLRVSLMVDGNRRDPGSSTTVMRGNHQTGEECRDEAGELFVGGARAGGDVSASGIVDVVASVPLLRARPPGIHHRGESGVDVLAQRRARRLIIRDRVRAWEAA